MTASCRGSFTVTSAVRSREASPTPSRSLTLLLAPIQLSLRLLIPEGSYLLKLAEVRRLVGPFDPETLSYRWTHRDPRVDDLQASIARVVSAATREHAGRRIVFNRIRRLACAAAGRDVPPPVDEDVSSNVPYLSEPWYCCAEPNPEPIFADVLAWLERHTPGSSPRPTT